MATPERGKEQKQSTSPEGGKGIEQSSEASAPVRRGQSYGMGPFSLVRQLTEDMNRLFGDFLGPSFRFGGFPERLASGAVGEQMFWPEIEVSHAGNKLTIQADLPGVKKDDVTLEVRDNELVISGERRTESERKEGGYYQSERSYGSFQRTIRLPEGAKTDTASATFENGVLKVEMEAPGGEQAKGRRIEVREGTTH
jgi:HSP20 family protein